MSAAESTLVEESVGNLFGARRGGADAMLLHLSNGATDVFFDVLTLAGSDMADTPWESNLIVALADSHRVDRGLSGFDLEDVPWTDKWQQEKAFFVAIVDRAMARHGWERLTYQPPFIADQLRQYREILVSFVPTPEGLTHPKAGRFENEWSAMPAPAELERCDKHHIYRGRHGCRICDIAIQPLL